jgi:hypothetical protein
MAISKNFLLKGVTGSINKQIVVRQLSDKTIISAYPDMDDITPSNLQLENQERMRNADEEAKRIMDDEQLRNEALVRLNVTRNKLYTSLISEYYRKWRESRDVNSQ